MTLSSEAQFVLRVLRREPVVGHQPDLDVLTAEDLAQLSPFVWSGDYDEVPLRFPLFEAVRTRQPRFDAAAASAAFDSLVRNASSERDDEPCGVTQWMRDAAAQVYCGFTGEDRRVVAEGLRRLLTLPLLDPMDLTTIVLLDSAGLPVPSLADELADTEARFLCSLASPADRIAGARAASGWVYGMDDDELTARGSDPMALLPGYLDLAAGIVVRAVTHLDDIHAGRVRYEPDKAFTVSGAQVLRRALTAGLDQECEWAVSAAVPLFAAASRAPDEKAATVPSQSATVAIAKAIAERPSVQRVAGLRSELARIRHAGMKKKVARLLTVAERRVFENEDFLLTRDPSEALPRQLSTAIARSIEALWLRTRALEYDEWEHKLLRAKGIGPLAAALVWQFEDRGALMVRNARRELEFTDVEGNRVDAPHGPVRLWHPVNDDHAERWRRRVVAYAITQPVNQVFREVYDAAAIASFLGVPLDVRTLLGLARSQSWRLDREGFLSKRFGAVRLELDVGRVYPGATGTTVCSDVSFLTATATERLASDRIPALALSESLRGVDLLISVAAFALDPEESPLRGTARARRAVLLSMLESAGENRYRIEGRYVVRGDVKIHIATGRATRGGVEVHAADPGARVRVLPYADETLQRIVACLAELPA